MRRSESGLAEWGTKVLVGLRPQVGRETDTRKDGALFRSRFLNIYTGPINRPHRSLETLSIVPSSIQCCDLRALSLFSDASHAATRASLVRDRNAHDPRRSESVVCLFCTSMLRVPVSAKRSGSARQGRHGSARCGVQGI
jgi:hypothetical protein